MKIPGMHYQDASWKTVSEAVAAALTDSIFATFDDHGRDSVCASPEAFLAWLPEVWATAEQLLRTRSYKNFKAERNCHQRDGDFLALDLVLALMTDKGPEPDPERKSKQKPRLPWPRELANVLAKQKTLSRTAVKKTCRDLFSEVRDQVDVQGFKAIPEMLERFDALQAALPLGQRRKNATLGISGPHLLRMRTVEQALHEFRWFLDDWRAHPAQVGELLGVEMLPGVEPLEVYRILQGLADGRCPARWLLDYHRRFAPRPKKLAAWDGPLLCGKKLDDNLWALQSLEDRVDEIIVELREYALLSEVQNNDLPVIHGRGGDNLDPNDPDIIDRMLAVGQESVDADGNRLQERPGVEAGEEAAGEAEEETADAEEGDEGAVDGEAVDWDVSRHSDAVTQSPGRISTSAGDEDDDGDGDDDDDDDDEKIIHVRKCLERFPLAIQVGVLIAVYPAGDAGLRGLLVNMDVFGRWNMAPALRPLTQAFLATKHEPPLGAKEFAGKVSAARVQFMDCCLRRLQQAADGAEGA